MKTERERERIKMKTSCARAQEMPQKKKRTEKKRNAHLNSERTNATVSGKWQLEPSIFNGSVLNRINRPANAYTDTDSGGIHNTKHT